jgi:hypothetical protein
VSLLRRLLNPYHVSTVLPAALRKITPTLVAFLEEKKAVRLEKLARDVYIQRFKDVQSVIRWLYEPTYVGTERFLPQIEDICLLPEIRSLIDIDIDIPVTTDSLQRDISPILPGIIARWRASIEDQIVKIAKDQLGTLGDVDLSQLGSAVFQCSKCHGAFWFPDVLGHHCLHEKIEIHWGFPWSTYEQKVQATFYSHPWSSKVLELRSWKQRVQGVISACGMDPMATRCEMNESDARLICKLCRQMATRTILTWHAAVLLPSVLTRCNAQIGRLFSQIDHAACNHIRASGHDMWERVSDEEATIAMKLEQASMEATMEQYCAEAYWFCLHCPRVRQVPKSRPSTITHVQRT